MCFESKTYAQNTEPRTNQQYTIGTSQRNGWKQWFHLLISLTDSGRRYDSFPIQFNVFRIPCCWLTSLAFGWHVVCSLYAVCATCIFRWRWRHVFLFDLWMRIQWMKHAPTSCTLRTHYCYYISNGCAVAVDAECFCFHLIIVKRLPYLCAACSER